MLGGRLLEQLHGRVADAAGGHVDRPAEGEGVVGRDEQAQVGDGVLDLGALPETGAADDDVRDARRTSSASNGRDWALMRNSTAISPGGTVVAQAVDLLGDEARLVGLVGGLVRGPPGRRRRPPR